MPRDGVFVKGPGCISTAGESVIPYSCRADKDSYPHNSRADKGRYRHDSRADKNPDRADKNCGDKNPYRHLGHNI